eukprot:scaffold316001_cov40-Tisochrysis_lutea.AAC.3
MFREKRALWARPDTRRATPKADRVEIARPGRQRAGSSHCSLSVGGRDDPPSKKQRFTGGVRQVGSPAGVRSESKRSQKNCEDAESGSYSSRAMPSAPYALNGRIEA